MIKLQLNNFAKLDHKNIWMKALIGMSIGFFTTLIISIFLKITTINLPPEVNTWDSPYIMIQVQNYLRFLTPFAIGIAIGYYLQLNIYHIITCGIVAILSANSTLVPNYDVAKRAISFEHTKVGLDFFKPQTGDIFAPLVSVIAIIYFFKVFSFPKSYFSIVVTPLFGVAWGLLMTITIAPLSGIFFVCLKYVIGISVTTNYWWSIVLAPVIGGLVGLALPLPISSAALAIALDLNGKVGLIALAGTTAMTIVIALMTYLATKSFSKAFVICFGTPMLLMDKYFKNHKILWLPLIASFVTSLLTAIIFDPLIINYHVSSQAVYVGLGLTGLFLPQILLMIENVWWIALLHIVLIQILVPIICTYHLSKIFFKKQWLKASDFEF